MTKKNVKGATRGRDGIALGDWVKQSIKSSMFEDSDSQDDLSQTFVQWTTSDDKAYFPASRSVRQLRPGVYEIKPRGDGSLYFAKVPESTEGLIKFPETNSQLVVEEIETFWTKEADFKHYELAFKRGILLYGPPGSGKTCTIKLAMADIIKRNGVVVRFCHPNMFSEGMRIFRDIQPKTPVIALMEDIDAIIDNYDESQVLNILDGVDMIERVVFIATTNYPERLSERVMNRPSRFDKRFFIGMPNHESRRIYLETLIAKGNKQKVIDIDTWVNDTEDFSLAHLKELFVAVEILGNKYAAALKTIKDMKKEKLSSDTYGAKMSL